MNLVDFLIINTHRQFDSFRNSTGDWLGIHYLSSFLSENGFQTFSFAGYIHEVPAILEEYMDKHGVRVVGLSCDYENQTEVTELVRYIKDKWNVPVIIGGPQSFELGEQFLRETGANLVVYGEGELTTLEVLSSLLEYGPSFHDILGIKFINDDDKFVMTSPRPLIKNLDLLPYPNEMYVLGTLFRRHSASFLTGRGCPFSCAFCFEGGMTKGVRWRSVENVINEIKKVLSNHPEIKYILFTDDTFTIDLTRVRDFCREFKKLRTQYKFSWYCEGHVRTLYKDPTIIAEMVDAGMVSLQIGIESGCNEILAAYNKETTVEMIEKVVRDAYSANLYQIWGNIILGGAMETRERIKRNVEFVKYLHRLAPGMLNIEFIYYWPLPGTKITKEPDTYQMKIVDAKSYSSRMDFPVVEFEDISPEELCNIRTDITKELRSAMLELVPNISLERGVQMVHHLQFAKGVGNWLLLINDNFEFSTFFQLLDIGATVLLRDIDPSELDFYHPLRTYRPEQFDVNRNIIYHGKSMSVQESQIIIGSAGKMTVCSLWKKLHTYFECKVQFTDCLRNLEQRRLLTFSKY